MSWSETARSCRERVAYHKAKAASATTRELREYHLREAASWRGEELFAQAVAHGARRKEATV